ncbi:MAG: DUF2325 domain-containing protein [Candidatus Woesearchaeota archaeon]
MVSEPRLGTIVDSLYYGKVVTVIGGVERADYSTPLKELGFSEIYRSYDKKSQKKLPGMISRSDIAILVNGCCSHSQADTAKDMCNKSGTVFVRVRGSPGPGNITNYLVENYTKIRGKL